MANSMSNSMAKALWVLVFCAGAVSGRTQSLWGENGNLGVLEDAKQWRYLSKTFLKCKVWQVEETLDTINCPYHYYCNTTYPGNYLAVVDWFAVLLAAALCLCLSGVMIWEVRGRLFGQDFSRGKARYWVPSGPLLLPLSLLVMAKGHRINSVFPMAYMAPAWLKLLHISALGFTGYEINGVSKNLNAVVFEVSMAVGMLHGSLYVDAVTLPYYTGVEASMSMSSGICRSCICRKEPLVAGGTFFYRAWSYGSFVVFSGLLSRLAYGLWWNDGNAERFISLARWGLELLAWGFTAWDVFKMGHNSPPLQHGLPYKSVMAPLLLMLLLCFYKRVWNLYREIESKYNPNTNYKAHYIP
ncbi:uncharacterized protein LOC131043935 [Cryptomeria japonica]|uniref:uncharacterized protein LOC131043935 n=1 Tax=Cryptomeria japonica TaxID=3369 RepID=UPI0025ABD608|nr:uncharacterized protein LOC131043935 [Cryptomeria japonica]